MKHLTTLLTMAITFTGLGQQMPYNPDANGDDFVGVDDVLGVLGVYDTFLIDSTMACDFEGTELEALFGGLHAYNLILDSVYVEYLLVDTSMIYSSECPDPVEVETVLNRSFVLNQINSYTSNGPSQWIHANGYHLGYSRNFTLGYYPNDGSFECYIQDYEVEVLTAGTYNSTSYAYQPSVGGGFNLPFLESWELDEDGIQIDWAPFSWASNCQSLRIIPFWHEAE